MFRADEVVEPGRVTRDETQRLGTHEGAVVLRVARTVVDVVGTPLEYVLLTCLADAYTYRTTLYASGS
jgi:DNA-binding GntR family transcriptional regulator